MAKTYKTAEVKCPVCGGEWKGTWEAAMSLRCCIHCGNVWDVKAVTVHLVVAPEREIKLVDPDAGGGDDVE